MMDLGIAGRRALVCAASKGLGRGCAEALARAGCEVTIVARTEGRAEHDVFPVCYLTNTRRAVYGWAERTGFEVESFRYLGQYPGYFMFNGFLFLLATAYEKVISR